MTLRGIGARVGVAPALVAHYSPPMDELVATTFVEVVTPELAEVERIVAQAATARDAIAGIVRAMLDGTRDDVTSVWVESWVLGRRSELLAAAVRDRMDAWQAVLERTIGAGVAEGSFHVDDAAGAAWAIIGMIDGLNAQALVRPTATQDRAALLVRAVDALLGAG